MTTHWLANLCARFRKSSSKPASRRRHARLHFDPLEERRLLAVTSVLQFDAEDHIAPLEASESTGEKPQSKLWQHDERWWAVAPNDEGTWLWRLEDDHWTEALKLSESDGVQADVQPVDNLAHVLLFDSEDSQLASLEYNATSRSYQFWSLRPDLVDVALSGSSETATIEVDSSGRLWIISDASTTIEARYSDGLYTSISAPITIGSGINSDDISVVTTLNANTIGVLWSNQSSDRFEFRTHTLGAAPNVWSAVETAAAQSALSIGGGMADDHVNLAVAADGTLYVAVKTSYDTSSSTQIGLLVRRPSGQWDNLYQVDTSGTRPIVVVSDIENRVIVAYTSATNGGDILIRESALDQIAFAPEQVVFDGNYNDVTSVPNQFGSEILFAATKGGDWYTRRAVFQPLFSLPPDETDQGGGETDEGPGGEDSGEEGGEEGGGQSEPVLLGDSVGHWMLNEATGSLAADSSGNGNDGRTAGNISRTTGPNGDGAFVFGDGSRVQIDDADVLDTSEAITIAAWIRPQRRGTQYVISKAQKGSVDGFELSLSNGGEVFIRFNEDSAGNDYRVDSRSSYPTNGNTWMHVAATFDGSTIRLYVNGVLESSESASFQIATNNLPLSIGAQHDGYRGINGAVDDVRIYDRALSAEEIGRVMAGQLAQPQPEPEPEPEPEPQPEPNTAPLVNAGADQMIFVTQSATLSGAASDDGQPANPGSLSTNWQMVAGPGQASFSSASSLQTNVTFSTAGVYTLQLSAFDGQLSGADTVVVTVLAEPEPEAPVNVAPLVNAGADQTIFVSQSATLAGAASDDGLPANPGSLSTTWQMIAGPGQASFGSASSLQTNVTFSTAGVYTLQLTAFDGQLSGTDTVVVTVLPDPAAPAASDGLVGAWNFAESTGTTTADASGLGNDGRIAGNVSRTTGPNGDGAFVFGDGSRVQIDDADVLDVSEAITIATWIRPGRRGTQYVISKAQKGSIDGFELSLSNGGEVFVRFNEDSAGNDYRVDSRSSYPTNGDTWVHVAATFDGSTISLYINGVLESSESASFQIAANNLPLSIGAQHDGYRGITGAVDDVRLYDRALSAEEIGRVMAGQLAQPQPEPEPEPEPEPQPEPNTAPLVNAGADQTIFVSQSATLSGTASDDGLLANPGSLSTNWQMVVGPGQASFSNATSLQTIVTFSTSGVYTLRLTAFDGELGGADTLVVNVVAVPVPNTAPLVNAGADQTVFVSQSATLAGTASDDGLPANPGSLSTNWQMIAGPGQASFGNASSLQTNVTFSTTGQYTLRLTAFDGQLSGSDTVVVTVLAVPVPNTAPLVNAGADQTIFVSQSATLAGTASDDGLPQAPGSLSTIWQLVSGPGQASFGNASSLQTNVAFSATGVYTLRLTAFDGELSGADTVLVNVLPDPAPPAAPDGLIGAWNFAESSGSTAIDSSPAGNNGQFSGNVQRTAGPGGDGALQFDGDSRVLIDDSDLLDVSDSITLAAWIRPERRGTQYGISKAEKGSVDGFELSLSNKGKVFVRFNQDSSGNSYRVDSDSSYSTNGNTWMHVAATYDGSTISLYINGVLESSRSANFQIATNNLPLSIGAQHDGYRGITGGVDDVRIYNRALSAQEIQALAQ